ncbi:MAG: hypothetical protein MI892_15190 [Desulfobacterales bacterium]|nr:hypothetical protein [Desulfobacterales bacterium]
MNRKSNPSAETTTRLSKRIFWSYHVDTWEASSQTQVQYCAENQLNKHTFAYWKSKLDRESSLSPLVPVTVQTDEKQKTSFLHSGIVLSFNDRLRIQLENGFNQNTLERVIDLLEAR